MSVWSDFSSAPVFYERNRVLPFFVCLIYILNMQIQCSSQHVDRGSYPGQIQSLEGARWYCCLHFELKSLFKQIWATWRVFTPHDSSIYFNLGLQHNDRGIPLKSHPSPVSSVVFPAHLEQKCSQWRDAEVTGACFGLYQVMFQFILVF